MAAETNPTDSVPILDNAVAGESLDEHLKPESEESHKAINDPRQEVLKRKEHKWHRGFELAFDTLKQRFLEFADDVQGSNEGFQQPSDKPDPIYPLTFEESRRDEQAPTEDRKPGENKETRYESEKANNGNVSYRADIYYHYEREGRLRFDRSIQNKDPFRTIHTRDRAGNFEEYVFEITVMYATPAAPEIYPAPAVPGMYASSIGKIPQEDGIFQPIKVTAEVGTYITIRSKYVLDILRDIVDYPRSLPPRATKLVLQEPFCMLLHHRVELAEHRDKLKQAALELASPERNVSSIAHEHLACLIDFTHQRYDDALSLEMARHQETPAMCTYEWVWLLFRPGSVVYSWDHKILKAHIVEKHDREEREGGKDRPQDLSNTDDEGRLRPPSQLKVFVWTIDFDGDRLGRRQITASIPAFDGEKSILSLPIFPKEYLKYDKSVHQTSSTEDYLIQRGKLFFEMARRSYREHDGETVDVPRRTIRGRVVIDTKAYYDMNKSRKPQLGLTNRRTDERYPYPGQPIIPHDIWEEREAKNKLRDLGLEEDIEGRPDYADPYSDYDDIDPYNCESLEPVKYLICNYKVWACVLKTRKWERLDVGNLRQPEFQVDLIKDLVLDENAKAIIKALSYRYTMQSQIGNAWSADFIRNKGEGQIFLLHGKPGVGKTTTAECAAEITRRPLVSLTCGDLGMEPDVVERELMKWLGLATSWEAILLLDEADVYLEARISQDLQRNTLVSIFLRALEYYQGLLFLTTNRVGTFDDAFVSRIHVVLHYPDFTTAQRGQIWDIFFNKLEREKENIKFTQRTVDYAKESKEMLSLGWNGREIRNAFNTAVGLAEYENERDANQKVVFHVRHLEQVVKMSRAFQEYLGSTHGMSLADQARHHRTRNDYWKGPSDRSVGSGAT